MEKYDVISVVGEGSYGLVMRCRHRESGQYVAIKKFLETEDDPTVRKMAMREIRMLKKLRHENLVNMIEVFRRKKRFFLVFEYLEHTVLEELEARSGGLGFVTSRKYIYQVLRALDFIHSNDVIHRDIKPENVLVSRLGVIKLCDFGFARPFAENETFTDYVATRWYRSPELLVGDPRYGKEVDIWAVGCLYAEMMTGEPLFPGESDIDQLFQIVRVLGKLNSRHQILVTRNTMFKGMKQEQNSSLIQLFPEWNRDSLDFLTQCLKMDGNMRPTTAVLLKHDLFTRDDFLDNFLPELRAKINQEIQKNPLLTRIQSYGSGRTSTRNLDQIQNFTQHHPTPVSNQQSHLPKSSEEKFKTFTPHQNANTDHLKTSTTTATTTSQSIGQFKSEPKTGNTTLNSKDRIAQIGLSLFPSKALDTNLFKSSLGVNDEFNLNLTSYKHYLNHNKNSNNNATHKPINISNLTFAREGGVGNAKYQRILSAKPKTQNIVSNTNGTNGHDSNNLQPPSPVQFQSLQSDNFISTANIISNDTNQKTSPVNVNNLTINGNLSQYFNNKRTTNILGFQKSNSTKQSPTPLNFAARTNLAKRDRGLLLDVGLSPFSYGTTTTDSPINTSTSNMKDTSPRVLPPPPWLTGNLKVSSQGKTTQIGKRGLTDWKTISTNSTSNSTNNNTNNQANKDDFTLPNCPGASTSPYKGLKKKLSPMPTISHDNIQHTSPINITTTPEAPQHDS